MRIEKTSIDGLLDISLEPFQDERGSFSRTFCKRELSAAGVDLSIKQANLSLNPEAYTLRGFHFQLPPEGEDKLIRCEIGRIFDVAIDMRPHSPSYLRWFGKVLEADLGNMLLVPKGCAHAFLTLEPNTQVSYLVSEFYTPGKERGIRYDDPSFDVTWPASPALISEKDQTWPEFSKANHEAEWKSAV